MRHWETGLNLTFFSLTGLVLLCAGAQLMMLPFGLRTNSKKINLNDLQQFHSTPLEPLENYQNQFSTHTLFSKPQTQIQQTTNLSKTYTLTGIVQGSEPEALIQNHVTKQTHFVQAGENFDQYKLAQINEHSIIVEYEGQRQELHIEESKS